MHGSGSINRRSKMLLLLAVAAFGVASCGSSSPSVLRVPAPAQQPAPGHDSPQAAVAGYMNGYLKQNDAMVCSYVAPKQQRLCDFLVGGSTYSVSPWRLGNSMVRGKEAIVVILAQKWCAKRACTHNDDPNKGLPKHVQGFEHAFDITPNAVPTVSLAEISGQWYVVLA